MIIAEISKMSVLERLQAMEALWDSFNHDTHENNAPSWHGEVLASRSEKIRNNTAQFLSLSEFKSKHEK